MYRYVFSAGDSYADSQFTTKAVVNSDGEVRYFTFGNFKSSCQIDVRYFPFDKQKCELDFGPWTMDKRTVILSIIHLFNQFGRIIK